MGTTMYVLTVTPNDYDAATRVVGIFDTRDDERS